MNKLTATLTARSTLTGNLSIGRLVGGNVANYDTHYNFPAVGDARVLYVAGKENAVYRWDEKDLKYFCVGRDYTELNEINGGNAND